MRYYSISINDATSGKLYIPPSYGSVNLGASWTSYANGKTLMNAQDIEIDIPLSPQGHPGATAAGHITVWGVSLKEIANASQLMGSRITLDVGYQKGLPLANPAFKGRIFSGIVFAAYGNWIGTVMTLDMLVQFAGGTTDLTQTLNPARNIVFNWAKGQELKDAITATLNNAFPDIPKISMNIGSYIGTGNDPHHATGALSEFADYIINATKQWSNNADSTGVEIYFDGSSFLVYDQTYTSKTTVINYQDLIGQPTWIDQSTIQFKCPMRADIGIGTFVQMPQPLITTSTLASVPRAPTTYTGFGRVIYGQHFGHFRDPSSESWASVFNMVVQANNPGKGLASNIAKVTGP